MPHPSLSSDSYFWQRTQALLGEQADQLFQYAEEAPVRGVTVNTRLLPAQEFAAAPPFALTAGGFACANFRLVRSDARPGLHPWHHAGVYYGQEPSASTAAAALDVRPGDRVLDTCAAPGGKSAQLSAALQGSGVLVSNEFDSARSRILLSNIERMGAPNVVVTNDSVPRLAQCFAGYFNKVLVDAPCSGEGMFRKEPQAVTQHSEALVEQCAALQAEILDAAARCLAPGGELVYSTCTFSPQEDEGQIGAFLAAHPDFELIDTGLSCGCPGHESHCVNGAIDVNKVRRIYPCHGGEGHFVAKLRRSGAAQPAAMYPAPRPAKVPKQLQDFLRQLFPQLLDRPLQQFRESFYLPSVQPLPSLAGLHLVRCGVQLGSVEKDRFTPAHHLMHAFGAQCANREELTAADPRTAAYLRGEEIEARTAGSGWCAVCVDGFALGAGKVSGGRVKNHYPKGLRNLK